MALGGCPSLFAPRDPESEARRALEGLSRTGLEIGSTPRPVHLSRFELSEIEVDGQDPPSVLFHVIAAGTYGAAQLGYYGSERVTFRRADRKLVAPASWLPKLEGVLRALAAGDAAPFGPSDSLSIRIDGDQAVVSALEGSDAGAARHVTSLQKLGDSWHF